MRDERPDAAPPEGRCIRCGGFGYILHATPYYREKCPDCVTPPSDAAQPEHTKLIQRIGEAVARIGKMCSEGRPPKMSIPVRPEDDDIFISETLVQCRDVLRSRDAQPEDAEPTNEDVLKAAYDHLAARVYKAHPEDAP